MDINIEDKDKKKFMEDQEIRKKNDKMEMLSMSSCSSLVIMIIFIGIGMTFNNQTYGIIIGTVASLIIIIPHIYIYSAIFTCNGSECSGYVALPFLTIMPSLITSIILVSVMFAMKSIE